MNITQTIAHKKIKIGKYFNFFIGTNKYVLLTINSKKGIWQSM